MSAAPSMSTTKLMTEGETADFLNISVRTLQAWRVKGEGPVFVSVGRLVRYDRSDLESWIESRKTASTSMREVANGAR